MTRDEVRAQLPSWVLGDLPDADRRVVQTWLDTDPSLRAECLRIEEVRKVARRALAQAAPAMAPPVRESSMWGLALGLAAVLIIGFAVAWTATPPDEIVLVDVARRAGPQAPGFLAMGDAHQLAVAFQAAGIGPTLSMVSDLSDLGMELKGGMVAPGPRAGTIVFYEKDGVLWQCHMYEHLSSGGRPVVDRVVEGVELRAFTEGDPIEGGMSWVVWQDGGLTCVLAAPVGPEAVLAAVAAKVEHAAHSG